LRGGKGDPRASMSAAPAAAAFVVGTDETPCNCCCFPLCPATTEGAIQDSKNNSKKLFFCCSSSSSFYLTAKKEAHISSVANSSSVSIVLIHRYVTVGFSILIVLQINLSLSLSLSLSQLSLSLSFSQLSLSCNNSLWQLKNKTACIACFPTTTTTSSYCCLVQTRSQTALHWTALDCTPEEWIRS
jgi:hypothetical protein